MRISFATDKRASNLARQIRQLLGEAGEARSMSSCREAVAVATGHRNWNELLKEIGTREASKFDEDMEDADALVRMSTFAGSLGKALNILPALARHVTDQLRPFASPAVREITDHHIALMAANITARGYKVSDLSNDGFAGFKLAIPARTVHSDIIGRDFHFGERGLAFHVARDGSTAGSRKGSLDGYAGDDEFTQIIEMAGLEKITTGSRVSPEMSIDPVIHAALRHLDRRALLLLRHSHTANQRAYRDAVALPEDSAIYRECHRYPVLARHFGDLSFRTKGSYLEGAGDRSSVIFSNDPVTAFAKWIESRSNELWPELKLTTEGVRATVEHYLSIPMKGVACVDPNAAAFLCHVPRDLWPKTSAQLGACVDFVDRHKHLTRPISMGGMGVLPATFGSEFARRANGDWAAMKRMSTISYMAFHQYIGSVLTAAAAREAGYEAFSGEFEAGRRGEISHSLSLALLSEVKLTFFEVLDFHARSDAAVKDRVSRFVDGPEIDDDETIADEMDEIGRYFEFGLIDRRHLGSSMIEIMNAHGFDVHAIVDIDIDDYGDDEADDDEATLSPA